MRVYYLHQNFSAPGYGGESRTYDFGWRLVRDGHTVTVITGNSHFGLSMGSKETYRKINTDGIEAIVLNCPKNATDGSHGQTAPAGDDRHPLRGYTRRAISAGSRLPRPDVVVAATPPLDTARAGTMLARRFRVPLVLEVSELWPEAPVQMNTLRSPAGIAYARILERRAYRAASRIIVHSPGMISGILRQGIPVERIEFIPGGADIDQILPGEPDEEFLKEHGMENRFPAVYAGNTHTNTGLELLIGAAATLAGTSEDIIWVIPGDGENIQELKRKVTEADLQDKIIFPGNLSAQDTARLYRSAGCLLVIFRNLPAHATGSPKQFFNGLAWGKPVITNITGWTADLLHDNNAGAAIPPGNFRELARAVESLSKRPELVRMMGKNARTLAEEKFDREMLIRKYITMLESV